jgi:hypothetical protein
MAFEETKNEQLAVLIDADNAQPAIIEGLIAEIATYGTANIKRIYGDWTDTKLNGWKKVLLQYSIQPQQQFGYYCPSPKNVKSAQWGFFSTFQNLAPWYWIVKSSDHYININFRSRGCKPESTKSSEPGKSSRKRSFLIRTIENGYQISINRESFFSKSTIETSKLNR